MLPGKEPEATLPPFRPRHRLHACGALDVFPLRALNVDQIAECRISGARQTADRIEQFRVDATILPDRRIDMGVNNAAQHDVGVAVGHDLCALASATRNGRTLAEGAGVRHAQSNSSSSCGKSPEVKFILSKRCIVTMLATNSGTARRFRRLSLIPVEPKAT